MVPQVVQGINFPINEGVMYILHDFIMDIFLLDFKSKYLTMVTPFGLGNE